MVVSNIKNSFPEMSNEQHLAIASGFYRHLCDLVVESIKIFTISEKEVMKRMVCKNPEVINRFYEEGRSVIVAGGHYNNWELFAVVAHKYLKHRFVGIYQPLKNKFFDNKMQETRRKFGLELLSTKSVRQFFENEKGNLTVTVFAIDQSPGSAKSCYWMTFLNQDTPVSFGAEKCSVEYNQPVVFGRLTKKKRGYYELDYELIHDNPATTQHGFITETATKMLEKDIIHKPEFWLWSHRRWKKKREQKN